MFRTVLLATLVCSTAGLIPAPPAQAAATVTAAEDGKNKINISGRQRMLSQRMAKAVCFAAIGVESVAHLNMAATAHSQFDQALVGLRAGNAEMGILPEAAPAILSELDGVVELWASYGPAVSAASQSEGMARNFLPEIASLSTPTLVQMNKAVGEFEKRYAATEIHPALALAINVSGRQRMLSQKSSKEFCLAVAGTDAEANRAALQATVSLFETSLSALLDGSDEMGLPEAPTDEIYDQLMLVQQLWTPVSVIFAKVAGGAAATPDEIAFVAEQNNVILVEMNKAVGMYAQL